MTEDKMEREAAKEADWWDVNSNEGVAQVCK